MDTIFVAVLYLIVFIGIPYFLAKRKGKDPLKFIVLGLFFSIFVWGYLIFCKSDYQEVEDRANLFSYGSDEPWKGDVT